ncbi:Lsr2 family protein [Pseudonocardia sp. ICBG601]|uniref:Lsr2 family protein n=1 Tax=Pseudonocardia sp. ICBG601 TaxID=2846759 RepID=UPI001CF68B77|nr:Lsr2 family protein [Pseudonocardia sp. ICBG601]
MNRPDLDAVVPDAVVPDAVVPDAVVPDGAGSGVAGEIVRVRRFAEVVRAARRAARGVEPHPVWGDREAEALTAVRVVSAFLDHHAHTDVARVFVGTLLSSLRDLGDLGELGGVGGPAAAAVAAAVTGAGGGDVGAAAGSGGSGSAGAVRGRRRRSAVRGGVAHEGDAPLALWPLDDSPPDPDPDLSGGGVSVGEPGVSLGAPGGADDGSPGEGRAVADVDQGVPRKAAPPRVSPVSVGAVRVWAQAQGYPVGARGRLSGQVRDAYLRAHPELLDPGGSGLATGGRC